MYDFIGDIHGFADELKALLEKMDYNQTAAVTTKRHKNYN